MPFGNVEGSYYEGRLLQRYARGQEEDNARHCAASEVSLDASVVHEFDVWHAYEGASATLTSSSKSFTYLILTINYAACLFRIALHSVAKLHTANI